MLLKVRHIIIFSFLSLNLHAQIRTFPKRYIQKIINDTTDISKPQFMSYPVVAYSPETSVELGLSGLYVRYAKGDTTNRLSEINAFTFYTLHKQFGGFFEHAIYSDKNEWFFLGKLKFQSFPLSYYGVGPETIDKKIARVNAFQVQIKERILKKVYKSIYAGVEFDLQHLGNVDFVDYDKNHIYEKPLGHLGSTNFGFGSGILFDNRHNVLNVRKGLFAELAFIHYDQKFGSQFTFTSIFSDFRCFIPIKKRNVLAFQYLGQFSLGNPPFNQMALMGGEMIMRGYYTGRYRDENLLSFQAEYRMLPFKFAKRFGASIFTSTGVVAPSLSTINSKNFVLAGGAGLRFLLFPKKDIWTRLDFALTKEGYGFYLFIGEAF
ncbi:MAG: BamA/TamA family outer membrane protein [Bacteroidota bacterium]